MKRILVALDSSSRAPTVLAAAARLAALTGGKLVVYRAVTNASELPREVITMTDARLDDFLKSNARAGLEMLVAAIDTTLVEAIRVDLAVPWDGVCRAARELDADVIVVGSHGYTMIDRMLGTTAAKIVNHADRNVLVVRTVL